MKRGLLLVVVLATAVMVCGCGKEENKLIKDAPAAKPSDIGDPAQIPVGVTPYENDFWIVKTQIDGEMRLFVLGRKVVGKDAGEVTTWNEAGEMFQDRKKEHRYDISGEALHTVPKGPNAGQPGFSLDKFRVQIDPQTGHILLTKGTKLGPENRNKVEKGAYVLVP